MTYTQSVTNLTLMEDHWLHNIIVTDGLWTRIFDMVVLISDIRCHNAILDLDNVTQALKLRWPALLAIPRPMHQRPHIIYILLPP